MRLRVEFAGVFEFDDDLLVVDPDGWELRRLEDAAGAETRWQAPETTPDLSDDAETLVLVGHRWLRGDRRLAVGALPPVLAAVVLALVGIVFEVTGYAQNCPLNSVIGLNTYRGGSDSEEDAERDPDAGMGRPS